MRLVRRGAGKLRSAEASRAGPLYRHHPHGSGEPSQTSAQEKQTEQKQKQNKKKKGKQPGRV
jgi:hypothetical protein